MESKDFLSKANMKKILLLCFLVILMFVAIENIGVLFSAIGTIVGVLSPFILGGAIAFIFNVPMKKIESVLFKKNSKMKGKRGISYLLSLILILGIIVISMFIIVPELIETVKQLTTQIPVAFEEFQKFMKYVTKRWPELSAVTKDIDLDYEALIGKIAGLLTGATGILSSTVGVVTSIVSGFATFFIAFAFSIYLLFNKEELARQFKKVLFALFPEKKVYKVLEISDLTNKTFSNFITGQCLEACILGFMFFVIMSIVGMPYAVLISVLIAITALIPIFGAFIGCAVGFLLILIVNPKQAIIFVIMFLILQQIEGNLIYPHVVGGSVGLPSIWVLVAITVGGDIMGVVGMIISIPLCSVIYALFREFVNKRVRKRKVSPENYNTPFGLLQERQTNGGVVEQKAETVAIATGDGELN